MPRSAPSWRASVDQPRQLDVRRAEVGAGDVLPDRIVQDLQHGDAEWTAARAVTGQGEADEAASEGLRHDGEPARIAVARFPVEDRPLLDHRGDLARHQGVEARTDAGACGGG